MQLEVKNKSKDLGRIQKLGAELSAAAGPANRETITKTIKELSGQLADFDMQVFNFNLLAFILKLSCKMALLYANMPLTKTKCLVYLWDSIIIMTAH